MRGGRSGKIGLRPRPAFVGTRCLVRYRVSDVGRSDFMLPISEMNDASRHLERALELSDEGEAPKHIGAQVDHLLCMLRDVISALPDQDGVPSCQDSGRR